MEWPSTLREMPDARPRDTMSPGSMAESQHSPLSTDSLSSGSPNSVFAPVFSGISSVGTAGAAFSSRAIGAITSPLLATPPLKGGRPFSAPARDSCAEEIAEAAARLLLLKVPWESSPTSSSPPLQSGLAGTPPLGRSRFRAISCDSPVTAPRHKAGKRRGRMRAPSAPAPRRLPNAGEGNGGAGAKLGSKVSQGKTQGKERRSNKTGGRVSPKRSAEITDGPPSVQKRVRRNSSASSWSRRASVSTPTKLAAASKRATPPPGQGEAGFFIKGTQGQLDVCEYRKVERGDNRPYLLVRLRGQSNTLPSDATLSVWFNEPRKDESISVHFARIRLKAGELKYDFLPEACCLAAGRAGATADADGSTEYSAPLLASIFSKKCWQGMVVRGPRMFVAFISTGTGYHSVPMFVEISPTSNSPEYRDPVLEYPLDILNLFFSENTTSSVFDNFAEIAPSPSLGGKATSKAPV